MEENDTSFPLIWAGKKEAYGSIGASLSCAAAGPAGLFFFLCIFCIKNKRNFFKR